MKKNETENCPCCPKHCPKDSLQCKKGQSCFQPDSLFNQLMEAAHTIMRSAHEPGFSEEIFFKALTVSEKNELLSLLKKINEK